MIGVLGGMGPAATVDFMGKLVRLTSATADQDHIPLVVMSDPRIPDRVAPILDGRGASPAAAMVERAEALERAGAAALAIPCHTAHYWAFEVQAAVSLPLLHIVDAVLADLERRQATKGSIGLLATAATLKAGLYQSKLEKAGYHCLLPDDEL
ncbi:MAG: aspartate/glutamate racemase family protein, partial [Geminicoccaceae bacterium]